MTMRQAVTIKVKIAESSNVLDRTMNRFSKAVQDCIDWAWNLKLLLKENCMIFAITKLKRSLNFSLNSAVMLFPKPLK